MLYVEVTTQLFVLFFAQDHLGAHIGRQSAELQAAIDAMPNTNQSTFLHTKAGEPRSAKALGNDFRVWCDKATCQSIARCTVRARAACASSRRPAATFWSCSPAAVTSRFTLSELQKYIDKADKRFAADRAAEKVIEHMTKQKTGRKIAA
jgi:hypothetical protein